MITSKAAISLVARREIRARLFSKAFIIGLGVTSSLIVLAFVLASVFGGDDPTRLGLVGEQPAAAQTILEQQAELEDRELVFEDLASAAAGQEAIENGDLDAVVIDGTTLMMKREDVGLLSFVSAAWQQGRLLEGLGDAGLSDSDISSTLGQAIPLKVQELEPDDDRETKDRIAFVSVVLLFLAIQVAGAYIMMGVLEEKSNKVVELILSSIKARHLLIGKILGIGVLGLVQMLVLVGSTIAAAALTGSSVLPSLSVSMVVWGIVWFLLGYLLYGSMFAAGASLVSRQEDAQGALAPVSVVIMLSYFGSIFSASDPDSTFTRVLSVLPPVAPFAMPGRLATGSATTFDVGLALVLTALTVAVVILLAERIYVRSVLHTDRPLTWREAWRLESS